MDRMSMLEHALQDRHVPDIWPNQPDAPDLLSWERRRLELVDLLSQHVYGYAPDIKVDVEAKVLAEDDHAFAGKAMQKTIELAMELPAGRFSFPLQYVLPYSKRSVAPASQDRAAPGAPLFIHIAFHPDVPDKYLPAEELIDAGFALLNFCYQDVALDREDPLATGLPGFFPGWRIPNGGGRSACGHGLHLASWILRNRNWPGGRRLIWHEQPSSATHGWARRLCGPAPMIRASRSSSAMNPVARALLWNVAAPAKMSRQSRDGSTTGFALLTPAMPAGQTKCPSISIFYWLPTPRARSISPARPRTIGQIRILNFCLPMPPEKYIPCSGCPVWLQKTDGPIRIVC